MPRSSRARFAGLDEEVPAVATAAVPLVPRRAFSGRGRLLLCVAIAAALACLGLGFGIGWFVYRAANLPPGSQPMWPVAFSMTRNQTTQHPPDSGRVYYDITDGHFRSDHSNIFSSGCPGTLLYSYSTRIMLMYNSTFCCTLYNYPFMVLPTPSYISQTHTYIGVVMRNGVNARVWYDDDSASTYYDTRTEPHMPVRWDITPDIETTAAGGMTVVFTDVDLNAPDVSVFDQPAACASHAICESPWGAISCAP